MINFVDIRNELSYQKKYGIPDKYYGIEIARKNSPLDFQYYSVEVVGSFLAIKVDNNGDALESINLSTSLINDTGNYHKCTGLTDYATDLDCGLYYFLVNSNYQSEYFNVISGTIDGNLGKTPITISGLEFYDTQNEINWNKREGYPVDTFGIQGSENSIPLPFEYLATDSISTFSLVNNETGETTSLSTSLIISDGTSHKCTGLVNYASDLDCGIYYFLVNDRYRSDIFHTLILDESLIGVGYDIIGSTLIVYP